MQLLLLAAPTKSVLRVTFEDVGSSDPLNSAYVGMYHAATTELNTN